MWLAEAPVKLRCDCCGKEVMAVIRGERLIITDRRHGRTHTCVVDLTKKAPHDSVEVIKIVGG